MDNSPRLMELFSVQKPSRCIILFGLGQFIQPVSVKNLKSAQLEGQLADLTVGLHSSDLWTRDQILGGIL
jgi:hypothetical protein